MTTGEIIRNARKEWHWSQKKLAKELDISRNSLSRIENGDCANMTAATAVKISRTLGISLDLLLCPEW